MSQIPPPAPSSAEQTYRFPCGQCGADYRFDPGQTTLTCDHCGHTEPLEDHGKQTIRELDFRAALNDQLPAQDIEETRVTSCPNCAAEVAFHAAFHATQCPFCATPVVADTGAHRQIKPRAVLPFSLNERQAHKSMNLWLGRLWFAPNGLKQYARKGRKMDGIYVPYWTYDADTKTRYTGQRGTIYYVTQTVMVDGKPQSRQVQKIRWTPASGRVGRFFDDVLVLASRSLPKRDTDALQPWDLGGLRPYSPEFIAGFAAEGYTILLDAGYDEARAHMDRVIERDVRFDIGGDRQSIHQMATDVSDVTFKHILLPVWLAAYKYRGKTYRFVVNGQSGKVQGQRPYSAWKITFAVLLGLATAGIIGFFIAMNQ